MRRRILLLAAGLLAVAAGSLVTARDGPTPDGRDADRAAIGAAAAEFAKAFAAGNASAVAAAWTENGELYDDDGSVTRGRAAIEKAYAEFFKAKPNAKINVAVQSIRFPSQDSAIEEGVMTLRLPGAEHPTSTWYAAFHVREGGRWLIAHSREWGTDDHKLDDLAWLVGDWRATTGNREVALSFAWNDKKTMIRSTFSVKEGGKVASSGTQTIGVDPATGQIRSWSFDEDGGRGEAQWFRDGGRWVQETVGVRADGTATTAFNVFTRVNDDEFLWRSVGRTVGADAAPDTLPIKVLRARAPSPPK